MISFEGLTPYDNEYRPYHASREVLHGIESSTSKRKPSVTTQYSELVKDSKQQRLWLEAGTARDDFPISPFDFPQRLANS
jgi:hypothetical protein